MEDGLRELRANKYVEFKTMVLILVLMEDGLRDYNNIFNTILSYVS